MLLTIMAIYHQCIILRGCGVGVGDDEDQEAL